MEEASLRFVSPAGCDNTAPRTVAFVMDNSGSLFGRGVSESDRTVRLDRATDPDLFRIAAAKTLLLNMAATTFGESSRTSVWSFRGESPEGVRPLTGSIDGEGSPYVGDVDIVRTAFDQLAVDSDFGRSNVFGALERVAGNMVDLGMAGEPDKTIILFTDGPDDSVTVPIGADADMLEQRRAEHEARLQQAIAAAVASGAQVFVVHLDAGIDVEGLALLRADDRALNLVPRDHEGRTGPLAEYQRIACETGGHYFYATDPFSLTWQFDRIADMLEGAWEVGLSIDGLGEGLSRGAYRLGANLEIGLDGRSEVTSLAPFGVPTSLGQVDTDDNRSVFVRP